MFKHAFLLVFLSIFLISEADARGIRDRGGDSTGISRPQTVVTRSIRRVSFVTILEPYSLRARLKSS